MPCPIRFGPDAEDHDLAARAVGVGLALVRVGAVQVRRERLELRRARVDPLVDRRIPACALVAADARRFRSSRTARRCSRSLNPASLQLAQPLGRSARRGRRARTAVRHAPISSANWARNQGSMCVIAWIRSTVQPARERAEHPPDPPLVGHRQLPRQRVLASSSRPSASAHSIAARPELQRAEPLQERLLERPPDRHRLAHRLHLRRQRPVRLGELLEVPARAP